MKSFTNSPSLVVFWLVAFVSPASAQITKAPTAAEISAKRRQVSAVYESAETEVVEGEIAIERAKPSLLADSDFLIGPHGFALVPKGSMVAQGKTVQLSSQAPTNGKLMKWEDFYRKHRAGIRFVEISESQWMGKSSLETLLPKLQQAQKNTFTTLTSLNGNLVSLPGIQKLLKSEE